MSVESKEKKIPRQTERLPSLIGNSTEKLQEELKFLI